MLLFERKGVLQMPSSQTKLFSTQLHLVLKALGCNEILGGTGGRNSIQCSGWTKVGFWIQLRNKWLCDTTIAVNSAWLDTHRVDALCH